MAKQQVFHKFIFKISSKRLREAKWNLTLPISEARKNDELISLSDSLALRWIDELNGTVDRDATVRSIRAQIKDIRRQPNSLQNRRAVRKLYDQLDEAQFVPDYLELVIDKPKELWRAAKGFKINGIKYVRLLGTVGGVKNSTITFVSERLSGELRKRVENGRDQSVPQIPAKLEAYKALTCSSSIPLSSPNGILVTDDFFTKFREDVIYLEDTPGGEPTMTLADNEEIEIDASDGCGMMCPALAERWSNELKLGYTTSGLNIRNSYTKGMVYNFDFHKFADEVAGGKYIVKDCWGDERDIRNVELVLSTSMLKLWKCYRSLEHYLSCCEENHYSFSTTKTCPERLEDWRMLNYQFINSYRFTDEQIRELIQATIDEYKDVLGGDWRKAILFMRGLDLDEDNAFSRNHDFISALMIDERMMNDPFVRKGVYHMLKSRITDAKIGVVGVRGNYSIISCDLYGMCQHIFGLEVTGLLKAGEFYNEYWANAGVEEVACFRAPMSCHNSVLKKKIANSDEVRKWFGHMHSCTVLNSWDTSCAALNGADFDGDMILSTNNKVLLAGVRKTRTVFCVQHSCKKIIVTEDDIIKANIDSFGDEIGKTTNWITSMYDVMSAYDIDSDEYKTLEYRIVSGQNYQQNCIDKAKGIEYNPMPKTWYDRRANAKTEDMTDTEVDACEYNLRIVADKKPYFMRYIYPTLMKQYNDYISNTSSKCLLQFRKTIDELLSQSDAETTDDEREFLMYYKKRMPVSTLDCVGNRVCRMIESEFDGILKSFSAVPFDYNILKSGCEYSRAQYSAVYRLFKEYTERMKAVEIEKKRRRLSPEECDFMYENIADEFTTRCAEECSNARQLCEILIDVCYSVEWSKGFAWKMCGDEIIHNLLENNGFTVHYPERCDDGDICYRGEHFAMRTTIVPEDTFYV